MKSAMKTDDRTLVSFDWAMKHILRNKANFDILEGFLSAVLDQDITILNLLESESNQEDREDKYNRVDLLVENAQKELIIIEVQSNREIHYLERLLYGASKLIVENLNLGDGYERVKKVISISVLYFLLGEGENDYVFYGTTDFHGLHSHAPLTLKRRKKPHVVGRELVTAKDIFPEYYLIEVEKFRDVIQSDLDEWIYLLKHSEVKQEFKSKNIQAAAEKLKLLKMPPERRKAYERYLLNRMDEREAIETAREDGMEKGLKQGMEQGMEQGLEQGLEKGKIDIAKTMLANQMAIDTIAKLTGLSAEKIKALS